MNIQGVESVKDVTVQATEAAAQAQAAQAPAGKAQAAPVQAAKDKAGQQDNQGQPKADSKAQGKSPEQIVKEANDYFQSKGVNLHFKMLKGSGEVQVEMVDATTEKLIRKIPQDDLLKLQENMKRLAKGVMDVSV